jgi:ribose 5-phosphate isomerase A
MSASAGQDQAAINELKQAAANEAAAQLKDGMIVGLGSGSTSRMAVSAIGKRVKEGLKIIGIPTSELTAEQATGLGIPLSTLGEYPKVDVTIDGADEVELGTLDLIKGGGGNLLREKIVAAASARFVVIVDETKLSSQLGTRFKVPVEVAQFGWQATSGRIAALGGNPGMRMADGKPYITDGGNYILDCAFGPIASASALQRELDAVVGVMEHGLFIGMTSEVLIGSHEGVKKLTKA